MVKKSNTLMYIQAYIANKQTIENTCKEQLKIVTNYGKLGITKQTYVIVISGCNLHSTQNLTLNEHYTSITTSFQGDFSSPVKYCKISDAIFSSCGGCSLTRLDS